MDKPEGRIKRKSRLAVFEHITEKQKSPKNTRRRSNRLVLEDSSPSESELVIDDKEEPVKKKRSILVKLTEEPLDLLCEWNSCDERFNSWSKFNTHLIDHATIPPEKLKCQWKDCASRSADVPLLIQHISYHGYLTKLKNIGQNVINRNKLPECRLKKINSIPVHYEGFTCEWADCSFQFYTIYEFYTHIEVHIKNNPKRCKENSGETIACGWGDCKTSYSTQYRLAEHVRTHTKERCLACPTCCSLFSCKTKFCDHRKKQLSVNLQSYQCSQCLKLFASERLLRDHMRSHINHYKCTMCDMTCPKPSLLAKHIRFKHIKDKPYKCNDCPKAFVTKQNLMDHVTTHSPEKIMHCKQCKFKCRSKIGLDNHLIEFHAKPCPVYECHCCLRKFKRGGYLTEHLMKRHNYHWPSGHSRFRYRKDQDGICRLQTVRYESLEVTQEMIRSESMQTNNAPKGESYKLRYDNDGPSKYILSVSENGEHSVKSTEPKERQILITINDVDEEGNIVNSKVVESGELVGSVIESDIVITEHPLQDKVVEPEEVVESVTKSDIEITEHPLSDFTESHEEERIIEPECERKSTGKRNEKTNLTEEEPEDIKPTKVKTEDKRYFSKEVILNYDIFKIETS